MVIKIALAVGVLLVVLGVVTLVYRTLRGCAGVLVSAAVALAGLGVVYVVWRLH